MENDLFKSMKSIDFLVKMYPKEKLLEQYDGNILNNIE